MGLLSSLFDKFVSIIIQIRCKIICCSKSKDSVSEPTKSNSSKPENSMSFRSIFSIK